MCVCEAMWFVAWPIGSGWVTLGYSVCHSSVQMIVGRRIVGRMLLLAILTGCPWSFIMIALVTCM
jgi:hypothetical protein